MAVKCIHCGGTCNEIGNGRYECLFCGATFDWDEITPQSVKQSASTKSGGGADVFEKNEGGILEISCAGKRGAWSGSGYLISLGGYAVTNAHVAADDDGSPCGRISVRLCGNDIPANVVALADDKAGRGNGVDLAIIKLVRIPAGAVALSFADSDRLRNGEPVYVIGNSLGQGTCITSGIVSDKARNINGRTFIMTDCAVNGGNSGGPIFNGEGHVIGTITMQGRSGDGADAEGMNYAIPANVVKLFIQEAKKGVHIDR